MTKTGFGLALAGDSTMTRALRSFPVEFLAMSTSEFVGWVIEVSEKSSDSYYLTSLSFNLNSNDCYGTSWICVIIGSRQYV